ncbi:hypothetical protein AB205_0175180, partial [Aquarana catesbeiana]
VDGSSNVNPPERCPCPRYSNDSTKEDHKIVHHDQVDGSSNENLPERCSRPLYSRDSTQEGHTIPHHHQVDGSSKGNLPERCPRPRYSQDSKQEDHTIPYHHQVDGSSKVNPPETCPGPRYSWDSTQEDLAIPHHHQVDRAINGNPPERCPCPRYSRDSTQENHSVPHHDQGEKLTNVKVEVKAEEGAGSVRGDPRSTEEFGMVVAVKEEGSSLDVGTGGHNVTTSERPQTLSLDYNAEDIDTVEYSSEAIHDPQKIHHRPYYVDRSMDSSKPEDSFDESLTLPNEIHPGLHVDDRSLDPWRSSSSHLDISHKDDKLIPWSEVNEGFTSQSSLAERTNVGERPYQCSECGKGGHPTMERLSLDYNIEVIDIADCSPEANPDTEILHHSPYYVDRSTDSSKPEDSFYNSHALPNEVHPGLHVVETSLDPSIPQTSSSSNLDTSLHQDDDDVILCSQVNEGFTSQASVTEDPRTNPVELPYQCSECGKGFNWKGHLLRHMKCHTDERPYSCVQCGKCGHNATTTERHQIASLDYTVEDDDVVEYSPEANTDTQTLHHKPYYVDSSIDPSQPEESFQKSHTVTSESHPSFHVADISLDPSNPQGSPSNSLDTSSH